MQLAQDADPGQQARDHPQRHRWSSGCAAPRRGRSPRRVSGASTRPSRVAASSCSTMRAAARQQARHAAEEAADLAGAVGGVLDAADRAEIALDPFAHHRLGDRPHVELRDRACAPRLRPPPWSSAAAAVPAASACRTAPVTSNSSVSSFAIEMSSARAVVDRLADGADRLREALDRMVRRHVAGLEMHLGRAPVVAGDEAVAGFRRGSAAPSGRAGP